MPCSVCAVRGVWFSRCYLLCMAWRDREGWLNFVFVDDCRVEDEKERDGVNHHEKPGLRELGVRVNLPSRIWQIPVPNQFVISPIRGVPNPIRRDVPVMSHLRSYPPSHSHLPPPCLSFLSTTVPSSQNTKLRHPSPSLNEMIISWHRIRYPSSTTYTWYSIYPGQHTPSTASNQHCLSFFHSHDYELTPECCVSFC